MIKKTIPIILCILMAFNVVLCSADTTHQYGDVLLKYSMYNELSSSSYWYIYKGKNCVEISSQNAFRGKTSMKIDVNAVKNSVDQRVTFHTTSIPITNEMKENSLLFEFYLNGIDCKQPGISFYAYFDDNFSKSFNIDEPDENGWTRVWAVFSPEIYDKCTTCKMAVNYNPTIATNLPDYFYLDEMSIRLMPLSIEAESFEENSTIIDLNNARVFGINAYSDKALLSDINMLKWKVVTGDASINDSKLNYTGKDIGQVRINCDFLGTDCEFTVTFVPKITYGINTVNDSNYIINLTNNTDNSQTVNLIVALYDGLRLYSVANQTQELNTGENTIAISKPRTPLSLVNANVKVFVTNAFDNSVHICDFDN